MLWYGINNIVIGRYDILRRLTDINQFARGKARLDFNWTLLRLRDNSMSFKSANISKKIVINCRVGKRNDAKRYQDANVSINLN